MSLKEKLLKNSTSKLVDILTDSVIFNNKESVRTSVPMINVALSGTVDGGMLPGLLMLAGPSKHFKSLFALIMAAAFLKKYPDGILLFYDSEFGSPEQYFKALEIPMDRVVHTPVHNVEELKFDLVAQLEQIERGERVFILIDSIGNLASKKEVEDAKEQKSVADMSRAKSLKSLFRIITPHLTTKHIPLVAVNHTYKEIGMFPKDIVGGGTGSYYSASDIWIIGRQQEKDGQELQGYNFVIKIEKSRSVQEGKKIPITVTFDGGINRWSGLFDVALAGGYITKPKVGWYALVNKETGEVSKNMRQDEIVNSDEIWTDMLKNTDFAQYIEAEYKLVTDKIL